MKKSPGRPLPFIYGATAVLAVAFAAELLDGLIVGRVQVTINHHKVAVDSASSPVTYWSLVSVESLATLFFAIVAALFFRLLMHQPREKAGNHGLRDDNPVDGGKENKPL